MSSRRKTLKISLLTGFGLSGDGIDELADGSGTERFGNPLNEFSIADEQEPRWREKIKQPGELGRFLVIGVVEANISVLRCYRLQDVAQYDAVAIPGGRHQHEVKALPAKEVSDPQIRNYFEFTHNAGGHGHHIIGMRKLVKQTTNSAKTSQRVAEAARRIGNICVFSGPCLGLEMFFFSSNRFWYPVQGFDDAKTKASLIVFRQVEKCEKAFRKGRVCK